MADEKDALLPPYLAFKTFRSAIQSLRAHGLPQTLDRTAWEGKSGTDQSQIMNSLKFFGLIDDKNNTLNTLKELVGLAEDTPEERDYLGALLRSSYRAVFTLDLKNVTPKQLEDAIGTYGIAGTLKDRAVRFFLKAATHAKIPLSTRLTIKLRERNKDNGESGTDVVDAGEPPKTNGKGPRRKKRIQIQSPLASPPSSGANALKTINLPNVGGTLTLSGTVNFLELEGEERELVYSIVDLMKKHEQKTKTVSE